MRCATYWVVAMTSRTKYCNSAWMVDVDAFRYAMDRAGFLTMAELSAASGVLATTVRQIVSGRIKYPSSSIMCDIARTLGCDVMDLMRDDGSRAES